MAPGKRALAACIDPAAAAMHNTGWHRGSKRLQTVCARAVQEEANRGGEVRRGGSCTQEGGNLHRTAAVALLVEAGKQNWRQSRLS